MILLIIPCVQKLSTNNKIKPNRMIAKIPGFKILSGKLAPAQTKDATIKDLLNDLELSSQTIVPKQNGELVIEESEIHDDDEIRLIQIIYGG